MRMQQNDFGIRAAAGETLTIEQLQRTVPAIFAEHPHDSRSQRFVHISTLDVMNALMRENFLPVEARLSRSRDDSRRGFTKHMVRFRKDDGLQQTRRVGDTSLEVILRNAHDGTAAYEFFAGLFRLACLNGMVVGTGTIESVKVRHSGNRQRQLDQVVEGAYSVIEHAPLALEAPRRWGEIQLSQDEQRVFAESALVARFGDSEGHVDTPFEPKHLLQSRRYQDDGNDLWRVFNRVQENAVKGGLHVRAQDPTMRQGYRNVTTREVRAIDGDVKLNRALWQLADSMAKLKAGN